MAGWESSIMIRINFPKEPADAILAYLYIEIMTSEIHFQLQF